MTRDKFGIVRIIVPSETHGV